MVIYNTLHTFLEEQIRELNCDEEIKAYVVGTLANYNKGFIDYSNKSITLIYANAKNKQDFHTFQSVGDYLLLISSFFPEHLKNASKNYYYSIAQISYYSCYKILNKKIKVYEKLADTFIDVSNHINNSIQQ